MGWRDIWFCYVYYLKEWSGTHRSSVSPPPPSPKCSDIIGCNSFQIGFQLPPHSDRALEKYFDIIKMLSSTSLYTDLNSLDFGRVLGGIGTLFKIIFPKHLSVLLYLKTLTNSMCYLYI
jgi:hypothetical protein